MTLSFQEYDGLVNKIKITKESLCDMEREAGLLRSNRAWFANYLRNVLPSLINLPCELTGVSFGGYDDPDKIEVTFYFPSIDRSWDIRIIEDVDVKKYVALAMNDLLEKYKAEVAA